MNDRARQISQQLETATEELNTAYKIIESELSAYCIDGSVTISADTATLSFDKLGDRWCLIYRDHKGDKQPLLTVSRSKRILAADFIGLLIDQVKSRAQAEIQEVTNARRKVVLAQDRLKTI